MPERVSVIVPVLDRASFIGDALESILAQTRRPDEIIVTDDGSTDGTLDVLARYREHIRLVHTKRAGPAGARNAALAVATGNLIGFLDSDDLWPADSLALQLDALASNPSADAVCGISETVLLEGGWVPACLWVAPRGPSLLGLMLFRSALLGELNGFDPLRRFGEDTELLARACAAGVRFLYHDHLVLIHRRHGGNMTNDLQTSLFERVRSRIRRRRAQGAGHEVAES